MSAYEEQLIAKLSEELRIAEASRRTVQKEHKRSLLFIIGMIIFFGVITKFLFKGASHPLIYVMVVWAGYHLVKIVYDSLNEKPREDFQYVYKELLIKNIAKELHPQMEFYADLGLSREVFLESRHSLSSVDRFSSEDFFAGQIGETELMFSEVHAEHRTDTQDLKGEIRNTWNTIFKGVFAVVDFNKHFKSWVLIKPERADSWVSEKALGMGQELQNMEDEEFEKRFRVYAGNQVEAHYILTPDLQQRICALGDRLGSGMCVSFIDSKVYISVPQQSDWFEFNQRVDIKCKDQMARVIDQIGQYFAIVELLDLNTRIWTKE